MLSPDSRSLVTAMLTPPLGMVLDSALATTYTLDPLTLLTMPLHLAWLASGEDKSLLSDGIRLYEALRRIGENLTVYADRGRIQAPAQAHPLYSLLEPMIVEVRAPGGGAFHPKLWVLRFVRSGGESGVCIRLGVLSRNLTSDRSWDLSLLLEGQPGGRRIAANREIGEFIASLPKLATGPVPAARVDAAAQLGEELRHVRWELPAGCDEVGFHILGRSRRAWVAPPSKQLVVISPFVSKGALDALCASTDMPVALVSRPQELAALGAETRAHFSRCLILDEAAESEDGEDSSCLDTLGLHAKALVLRSGWDTRLFVGSVNATDAALRYGNNIEVWAELVGKSSKFGNIDGLLGGDGFGGVLTDFDPATPVLEVDAEQAAAEQALEAARSALISSPLSIHCQAQGGEWRLILRTKAPVVLNGVVIAAWPLSIRSEQAVSAEGLAQDHELDLGLVDAADITGMTGFILTIGAHSLRFALNLPLEGVPPDRDASLIHRIVQNREGFLRYLLLLLGEFSDGTAGGEGKGSGGGGWGMESGVGPTLLEEMVRTFTRDRARLNDVKQAIERLQAEKSGGEIIPHEFLALWNVFVEAMEMAP